jgi:hypothetical protein
MRLSLVSCDGKKSFEDVAVAKYMNANFVCIKSILKSVLTWIKVYMTAQLN